MELMREAWSDDRLDDLNRRVENGFNRVDADIRELRREMNDRFDRVDARFDAMQRLMIQGGAVIAAALIGLIATMLGLLVTQI